MNELVGVNSPAPAPCDVFIVGAGGAGRDTAVVVWDLLVGGSISRLLGFVAREAPRNTAWCDVPWLGAPEAVLECVPRSARFVVAVGDGGVRRTLHRGLEALGYEAVVLVHPTAQVGRGVTVGPGTVIPQFCVITTDARIGAGVQFNLACTVSHDLVVEDFVTMAPRVTVTGSAVIREGATLYAGSTVAPGVTIGRGAVLGAGAVALRDVPDGMVAVGVPARIVRPVRP